jgi:hypothetical protein
LTALEPAVDGATLAEADVVLAATETQHAIIRRAAAGAAVAVVAAAGDADRTASLIRSTLGRILAIVRRRAPASMAEILAICDRRAEASEERQRAVGAESAT